MYQQTHDRCFARLMNLILAVALLLGLLVVGGPQGASAAEPIRQVSPSEGVKALQTASAEYNGRIYVIWRDGVVDTDKQIRLSESTDLSGSQWSAPATLNKNVTNPENATIQADGAGRLHAVWNEGNGSGKVIHAWWKPDFGGSPTSIDRWRYEEVSNNGKHANFALDPAGNAYIVWTNYADGGVAGRKWQASNESLASAIVTFRRNARMPNVAATADGALHTVFVDNDDRPKYLKLRGDWSPAEGEAPLGDTRAESPPLQIVAAGNDVHLAWAMEANFHDGYFFREIFYAKRPAGAGLGGRERVSRNLATRRGANHVSPALAIDGEGRPWVAWQGAESGVTQVYERRRGDDGNPWPDYSDAAGLCVSCAVGGGAAINPQYGVATGGRVDLTWAQLAGSARRVYYAQRTPPPPPPPAPPDPTPLPSPTPPTVPGDQTRRWCPGETNKCVAGDFLVYWETRGGLAFIGFPISEPFVEQLEDGNFYTVQYFERARMEYHPENNPPYQIELGHFGRRIYKERLGREPDRADPVEGHVYFDQTGHNLSGDFLAFWQDNGGLDRFGYPISEVFTETLEDGRTYTVQYFERARFEHHPENAAPFDILLGQFGRQILGGR